MPIPATEASVAVSLGVIIGLFILGVVTGSFSALMGIGGGLVVVPCLLFFFGFTQLKANGTSLAMMLPPVGALAVLTYWRAGNVDVRAALLLAAGFALGAYLGAVVLKAGYIDPRFLRTGFAVVLVLSAIRILPRGDDGKMLSLGGLWLLMFAGALYTWGRIRGRTSTATSGVTGHPGGPTTPSGMHDYEI